MSRKIIKNSLGYDSNLYVYQDKQMFNYSVDTILLGNFITLNRKVNYLLEIGANNGALSIFIAERDEKLKIDAIEIQEKAIELAKMNVRLNEKNNQIKLILNDFNLFYKEHSKNQLPKYDAIVCNPPFYKVEANIKRKNASQELLIATHEIKLNLEQIISGSAKIIKQKGYLSFVIPTERMVDCLTLLRKYNFEPKRVQMIYPREDEKSNLVLIESRFATGWGTFFDKNIYLHLNDKFKHEYRDEVKELYKPKKVKR
ncbi:tRNA1(Val) (adenine(37)-N6)-methyltransferase [Mesomycoplasma lagogenitalium]|uniref:tRNA1(Val) (Adenine(37)-N6)-methyltransferase n=1 Tax=Mesomycoplasma lagogenitalium TaxID=171286 RepID=A0ABY8LWX6_9BACT|nr:tRNA1(Val) (adenine(37)-N6)-methyltransferase [Mesomycoplasma lagogenitalium]WGI36916.1 tRNA1(Val) (adenine(37)-N6)-methyltransferase [Mesomycoplasma lagogenitalium]